MNNIKETIRKILREEKLPTNYSELIKTLPEELKKLFFKQWSAKQNPEWHPEGNSLKHIIVVLKRAYHHYPEDPNMIMTALFHDLGKMDTYNINPKTGKPTAYGHEFKSTDYVEKFRDWIESFEGTDVDEIKFLVQNHMKVKPRTWDSMRDIKKEPIMNNPAFDKLMGFTEKLDGGGTDLKESIRKILREESKKERVVCKDCGWSWDISDGGKDPYVCHKCWTDNSEDFIDKEINYTTKKSKIHGKGVFATQPINSGGETIAIKIKDNKYYYTELARFINHSENSNAKFIFKQDKVVLKTTKPIKKGEEILCDYSENPEPFEGVPTSKNQILKSNCVAKKTKHKIFKYLFVC